MTNIINQTEALKLLKENKISKLIDNTLLRNNANKKEIEDFICESLKYNFYSVCLNPCWVKKAKELIQDKMEITTVVGFPLGSNTIKVKLLETEESINSGATEIDMVINIGLFKSKKYKEVEDEISKIKRICGNLILKVIIESSFLNEDEIITITKIVENSGADFIKTSTGFLNKKVTIKEIQIIKNAISGNLKIKASGGIRNFLTMKKFIHAGATRIGTSNGIKIIKEIMEFNR